jgi:aconitate hydratase
VRAVIAQSFERIHRSNLVGMGVMPSSSTRASWQSLGITGDETVTIEGLAGGDQAAPEADGGRHLRRRLDQGRAVICRIDTLDELEYFKNGGILHYVLRDLAA